MRSGQRRVPRLRLSALAAELRRSGVAQQHVRRAVAELEDHYADLVDDAQAGGVSRAEAESIAESRLGGLAQISQAYRAQPALRGWAYRWPHVAIAVYPLACLAALPAAPFAAGARHRDTLLRWTIGLFSAAAFTATLLLALQLTIRFA